MNYGNYELKKVNPTPILGTLACSCSFSTLIYICNVVRVIADL